MNHMIQIGQRIYPFRPDWMDIMFFFEKVRTVCCQIQIYNSGKTWIHTWCHQQIQCFLRKENSVSFKFTTPAKHESIVSRLDVSGAHSFPKGIAIISLNYLILQRYDDVMWQHEGVTLSDRIVQQKEMKSYN